MSEKAQLRAQALTAPIPPGPPRLTRNLEVITDPAVRIRSLVKVYGRDDLQVRALDDVNLDFRRGEFTAIMGPSGSGKSTLLHVAAGLDSFDSGEVTVGNISVGTLSERARTNFRRTQIGFIFQSFNLVSTLTAGENITLPLDIAREKYDRARFDYLVDTIGLRDRLRHRPAELSGGQQQKVACARALLGFPAVIFADEPTGNLDSQSTRQVLTLLRAAAVDDGQTVVLVTHEPAAAAWAQRVIFIAEGQVIGQLRNPTRDAILEAQRQLGQQVSDTENPQYPTEHPSGNVPPHPPESRMGVTKADDSGASRKSLFAQLDISDSVHNSVESGADSTDNRAGQTAAPNWAPVLRAAPPPPTSDNIPAGQEQIDAIDDRTSPAQIQNENSTNSPVDIPVETTARAVDKSVDSAVDDATFPSGNGDRNDPDAPPSLGNTQGENTRNNVPAAAFPSFDDAVTGRITPTTEPRPEGQVQFPKLHSLSAAAEVQPPLRRRDRREQAEYTGKPVSIFQPLRRTTGTMPAAAPASLGTEERKDTNSAFQQSQATDSTPAPTRETKPVNTPPALTPSTNAPAAPAGRAAPTSPPATTPVVNKEGQKYIPPAAESNMPAAAAPTRPTDIPATPTRPATPVTPVLSTVSPTSTANIPTAPTVPTVNSNAEALPASQVAAQAKQKTAQRRAAALKAEEEGQKQLAQMIMQAEALLEKSKFALEEAAEDLAGTPAITPAAQTNDFSDKASLSQTSHRPSTTPISDVNLRPPVSPGQPAATTAPHAPAAPNPPNATIERGKGITGTPASPSNGVTIPTLPNPPVLRPAQPTLPASKMQTAPGAPLTGAIPLVRPRAPKPVTPSPLSDPAATYGQTPSASEAVAEPTLEQQMLIARADAMLAQAELKSATLAAQLAELHTPLEPPANTPGNMPFNTRSDRQTEPLSETPPPPPLHEPFNTPER